MEYNGFLEELLALRSSDQLEATIPTPMTDFYTNGWSFDENPFGISPNPPFQEFSLPLDQSLNSSFSEFTTSPFGDDNHHQFSAHSSTSMLDTPPFPTQLDDYSLPIMKSEEPPPSLIGSGLHKLEPILSHEGPDFNPERKNRVKKVDGQPSKNLMAERRRRKRLNDRLSMLRSVVPKISKMDRTSILGDTIDYMRELLDRINNLQEEIEVGNSSNQSESISNFKDVKPNEALVRNSPKFDVERRDTDTRIEISCAGKPGLLLSTVTSLEALGLEIQQCVISCFNDFALQASCSEELEQREIVSSEEIKQALFRNAGYGGRCL